VNETISREVALWEVQILGQVTGIVEVIVFGKEVIVFGKIRLTVVNRRRRFVKPF